MTARQSRNQGKKDKDEIFIRNEKVSPSMNQGKVISEKIEFSMHNIQVLQKCYWRNANEVKCQNTQLTETLNLVGKRLTILHDEHHNDFDDPKHQIYQM